jgi:hypothetical protein
MLTEDITLDDSCLGNLGDITDPRREDGISVVDVAILGQEANEMLENDQPSDSSWEIIDSPTVNVAMMGE